MLKTKCIYTPKSQDDGTRISIMSRHTLDDWITPDVRISQDIFDTHLPIFAPLPKTIWKYLRQEIDFAEYTQIYKDELETKISDIIELVNKAVKENITIMCKEELPEFCHRKIFAEFALKIAQIISIDLEIRIE